MATRYRCPQGHLWEDLLDASLVDGEVRCPVCGRPSRPSAPVADASGATALLAPVPADPAPTRKLASVPPTDPALTSETPLPAVLATVVKPALAGVSPTGASQDFEVAPAAELRGRSASAPALDRTSEVQVAPFVPAPAEPPRPADVAAPVRPTNRSTVASGAERPRTPGREDRRTAPLSPAAKAGPEIPGYEILEELGRGGMGVVYKARQVGLNRLVALKMILAGSAADDRDRARFKTEAEAIARLSHPNIVQIFEVGEHQGSGWFSLEFVDGGSLSDRLKGEPLPVHASARLVETLARAAHFAHEHGVVHRDLKPANVLLQKKEGNHRGTESTEQKKDRSSEEKPAACSVSSVALWFDHSSPKLTDFGLAKTLDADIHHTRSGMVVGTPGYMAPEQATGGNGVGPATDTYALGVILYQLVTGKLPFVAETPMEVMIKVTQEEPTRPRKWQPRLAADLETIILKCLEKDPRRRYASALELAEDLRRFQAHEPILARPVRPLERSVRWVRRRPALAGMMLVAVLGGAAALATLAVYERREKARRAEERRDVEAALTRVRASVDPEERATYETWQNVGGVLDELAERVRKDPALADLAGEVQARLAKARGYVNAGKTYIAFTKARDEALFQATLASGTASPAHLQATRDKVERALAAVGASASAVPKLDRFFSKEQQDEIKRGCYELLLVLSDTMAQPLPGQNAEQRRDNARAALAVLDTADDLGVKTRAYHLRKARILTLAGSEEKAKKERAQADRQPASTDTDFYLEGSELYRRGDVVGAQEKFEEAQNKNPAHFWARFCLALCQVRQGKEKHLIAAHVILTGCLRDQPGELRIYLLRGFVHGQLKHFKEALDDFAVAEEALNQQQPPDEEMLYALYNNRAVTRMGLEQYAAAEADLRAAIKLDSEKYQAYVALSQVYRQEGKHDLALETLNVGLAKAERLLEKNKLDVGTFLLLKRLRYAMSVEGKNPKAALEDLTGLIGLRGLSDEARARTLRDLGHLYYRERKFADALRAYDEAGKLREDAELERWRGEVLLRVEPPRYADAIRAFTRHLEGAKTQPHLNVYRGRAFARMKLSPPQYQEAALDYTQALGYATADPAQRGELHLQRGHAYLGCKFWELAAKDFEAALNAGAPEHAGPAHQGRAVARLQLKMHKGAAEDAEAIVRLAERPGAADAAEALYGAACILAQVAGQINPFDEKEAAPVRGRPRHRPEKENGERQRYTDRAAAVLEQALDALPREKQAAFWKEKAGKESALEPLSKHETYIRLKKRYSLN
jgi:serine/threonine protein kinase/Tfp pilus assembly protein PilF